MSGYTLDFDKMLLDLIREEASLQGKLEQLRVTKDYILAMRKKPAEQKPPFDFTKDLRCDEVLSTSDSDISDFLGGLG